MTNTVTFVNQKGGVGKTSTSYNLAYCLASAGKKTLLIDLDPSRNATKPYCNDFKYSIKNVLEDKNFDTNKAIYHAMLKENPIENLDIIPSHVSLAVLQSHLSGRAHKEKILKKQLEKIEGNYDYYLLDLPPMLSDFSINGVYAADFIGVPLRYEKDALEGINDLFDFVKEIKETHQFNYKILRNGFDARKKTVNLYVDNELKPFLDKGKVFSTIIRQDEEINKAKLNDEPVITFSPKSGGAQDYISLAKEIQELFHVKN